MLLEPCLSPLTGQHSAQIVARLTLVTIDFILLLLNRTIYSFCLAFCFRHCVSAMLHMFLAICCLLNKTSEYYSLGHTCQFIYLRIDMHISNFRQLGSKVLISILFLPGFVFISLG